MKLQIKKSLAALAAAVGIVTTASAVPQPLAVWDGTFGKTAQGQSVVYNGNATEGGILTIGQDSGAVFTGADSSLNNATFIIKCSGLNLASANNQYLLALHQNSLGGGNGDASYNKVGVSLAANNAKVAGVWGDNNRTPAVQCWEGGTASALSSGDTTLAVNIQTSGGVYVWEVMTDAQGNRSLVKVLHASGLKASDTNYKGFTLGGKYYDGSTGPAVGNLSPATGWKVEKLAVFGSTLTEDQIKAFRFASDVASDYLSVLSLNFGANTDARKVTAGTDPCAAVADSNWYNLTTQNGTDVAVGSQTVTWSCKNLYQNDGKAPAYLKGYLDDGAGTPITVSGLTGARYDVYIYCNSDNSPAWSCKTVNGTSYCWDDAEGAAKQGTSSWGGNGGKADAVGANVLLVKGVYPNAEGKIVLGSVRDGAYRGCVAAVQLCERTSAKVYTATVAADTAWPDIAWNEAIPEGGIEADAALEVTVTGSPAILFAGETIPQKVTFAGAPVLKATDAFYTDGCWEKTVARFGTLVRGGATAPTELKDGFSGAYALADAELKLRAQNREVISINIGGGREGGSGMDSDAKYLVPSNDTYYGLAPVKGETWNNINRKWKTAGLTEVTMQGSIAAQADGSRVERPTIDLSAKAKETYSYDCNQPYLSGYLDDGLGVTVSVHGVPYAKYDVIVYSTSDTANTRLNPITVNGVQYTYVDGDTVRGDTVWGVGQCKDPQFGGNALYIRDCSGEELSISSARVVGRGTICAVQVICQGDILLSSSYVADVNETTDWKAGAGEGLTPYGQPWENGQLSTLTLTNKANATLTFDTATTGLQFKVVSEAGSKLTIPASCFGNLSFGILDFSEALGQVEIDLAGVADGEKTLLAGSLKGSENVTGAGSATCGAYADANGIHMAYKADATRANPVTGEEKDFSDAYFGEDGAWGTKANWRKVVNGLWAPEDAVPGVSGGRYTPILVDGALVENKDVTVAALEGWNIQYAFLNGAQVTANALTKAQQGDQVETFIWVDETSSVTFGTSGGNNRGPLALSVAARDGVTFRQAWSAGDNSFSYYFKGFGSVNYAGGLTAGSTHEIRQAEIQIGAGDDRTIRRQPLITYASTTKDFIWTNVTVTATKGVTPVLKSEGELSLEDDVGTYTFEKTGAGVNLVFVDYATVYAATVSASGEHVLSELPWSQTPFAPTADTPVVVTIADTVDGEVVLDLDVEGLTVPSIKVVSAGDATLRLTGLNPASIGAWDFSDARGRVTFGFAADFARVITGEYPFIGVGYTYAGVIQPGCEYLGADNVLTGATLNADVVIGGTGTLSGQFRPQNGATMTFTGTYGYAPSDTVFTGVAPLAGTVTVAEGADITLAYVRGCNAYGVTSTLNVAGRLTIDTATDDSNADRGRKGILFNENPNTTFALNVTGELAAERVVLYTARDGGGGTITVDGGMLRVKGVRFTREGVATAVTDGGTLALGASGLIAQDNSSYVVDGGAVTSFGDADLGWTPQTTTVGEGGVAIDANGRTAIATGAFDGEGAIAVRNGDVLFTTYRGAFTEIAGGKGYYAFTVGINDLGRFTVPGGMTAGQIKLVNAAGQVVPFEAEGDVLTFDWQVTDGACWWDYEFEGGVTSTGTDKTTMTAEGAEPYYNVASNALWVGHATHYRSATYPAEFTAVVYGKVVDHEKHVELGFGSTANGSAISVALACGNPTNDEVRLLVSNGFAVQKTVTMSVPNAYASDHLYAFVCKTVVDNDVEKTKVLVYLDGTEWDSFLFDGKVTLGSGFQVGSVHGGAPTGYSKATTANENAFLDFLRVYDVALSNEAMSRYADEYPYHSVNGNAARTFVEETATWTAEDAWEIVPYEGEPRVGDKPPARAIVSVKADGQPATVTVDLDESATYEQLKVQAGEAVTLRKGGTVRPTVSGLTTVGEDLTVDFDAIGFGNVMVADGKTLTFDCTGFPLESYFADATYELTGKPSGAGEIVAVNIPTAGGRTATFGINPDSGHCELRITVKGPLTATVAGAAKFSELVWTMGGDEVDPDWTRVSAAALDPAGAASLDLDEALAGAVTFAVSEDITVSRSAEGATNVTLAPAAGKTVGVSVAEGETSGLPCAVSGGGTIVKVGAGTLLTAVNRAYLVREGTLRASGVGTTTVTVEKEGVFDVNGKPDSLYTVVLNGGRLINGSDAGIDTGHMQYVSISQTADSEIGGASEFGYIRRGYAENTFDLGGATLTKTGDNRFTLCNCTVTNGAVVVAGGMLAVDSGAVAFAADASLTLEAAGTLKVVNALTVGAIAAEGGTIDNTGTISAFTLTGDATVTGNGTYGAITLAENAALNVGQRRGLALAGAGTVRVDLTEAEFSGISSGTPLTVFTSAEGDATAIGKVTCAGRECRFEAEGGRITSVARVARTIFYIK